MNKKGLDLKSYLTDVLDMAINEADKIFKFNQEELEEYKVLLENLKDKNSSSVGTIEKGDSLERIVSFVLDKSVIFEVYENVRTSSNEIDQLIRFNKKGDILKAQGFVSFDPTFLCECKNYQDKVSVTWVGKFYSLMKVSKKNLGIIFSYHGFTGANWSYAAGLAKKIYLSDDNNSRIIDFNIYDFNKLAEGRSFIELIDEKIFNLENDTNIKSYITSHPGESFFTKA